MGLGLLPLHVIRSAEPGRVPQRVRGVGAGTPVDQQLHQLDVEALLIRRLAQADVPERRVDFAGFSVCRATFAQQAANRLHIGASRGLG